MFGCTSIIPYALAGTSIAISIWSLRITLKARKVVRSVYSRVTRFDAKPKIATLRNEKGNP